MENTEVQVPAKFEKIVSEIENMLNSLMVVPTRLQLSRLLRRLLLLVSRKQRISLMALLQC
jgi:hypothetical protein